MKILIVDDIPISQQAVREILRVKLPSTATIEATNGKDAMEQFENHRPQLVFMDIRLPHLNGPAATRRMKRIDPDTAVIMLTNHDTQEYRETAKQYGADGFLLKGGHGERDSSCPRSLAGHL